MTKLTTRTKEKLNTLARILYSLDGYRRGKDFDFSTAFHPQEKGCWNKAVVAYSFLQKKPEALEWQVGRNSNWEDDSEVES